MTLAFWLYSMRTSAYSMDAYVAFMMRALFGYIRRPSGSVGLSRYHAVASRPPTKTRTSLAPLISRPGCCAGGDIANTAFIVCMDARMRFMMK